MSPELLTLLWKLTKAVKRLSQGNDDSAYLLADDLEEDLKQIASPELKEWFRNEGSYL